MKIKDLQKYKKILLVGYGIEGKSTETFLKKYVPDAEISITDKINGLDYLANQNNYDLAIKSPGIHKSQLKIPYTTATNIFFDNVKGLIIGITGTKGKSTTTALIYHILKKAFGKKVHLLGNITHKLTNLGKPLLSAFENDNKNQIYVCELSSFQLDDLKKSPQIAVFTSFFPEHMDFHGSMKKYLDAKTNITKFQTNKDYFIYNSKFKEIKNIAQKTQAKTISINDKKINYKTNLLGEHNISNLKLAVLVARILKINEKIISDAIKTFKPLPHRLENIGVFKDIIFYDDAISTTPESTIAAIKTIKNIGTIFLGGQDRGYNFEELAKTIIKYRIPNLVFFPDSGKTILKELKSANQELRISYSPTILKTISMKEAVEFAYKNTKKGEIVLLSNASPSYSLWKNFEEKAEEFSQNVKNLRTIDTI